MVNRLTKSSQLTENEAINLSLTNLYMRLQAYEDTGLEPEEINCVNTNVYVNWRDDVFNDSETEKLTIDSVGFMTYNGAFYAFDEIGKTVFLTREDAEKALEGMNDDER